VFEVTVTDGLSTPVPGTVEIFVDAAPNVPPTWLTDPTIKSDGQDTVPYSGSLSADADDPESDPLGAGWNIMQSTTAIGSGGVLGKGLLAGTQSHLDFLPEARTDFIIAVVGEELGLVGVLLLLALYLLVIGRGLFMAASAESTFGRLLSGALILTFFVYVFVNIAMVSGLLPVVGVPLPLVSYGGTSAITLMASFGILMAIRAHKAW
jgi:rod shape determining protein RodA